MLQGEALYIEARRRTGLEDFGDPPPEPVLSVLVNSLEGEADLHPLGRFLIRVHLLDLLETRLRLGQALLGNLLGIPGEMALALSLVRRVRELVLGIPGLVAWQLVEAGRLLRHRRRAS